LLKVPRLVRMTRPGFDLGLPTQPE
jgi:hypothetical protein